MFSTYHMTNPAVFYNKEDQWEVPAIDQAGGQASRMLPWYTIMRLPGEERPEFIQMLPFTPRQKDNLAAWMVARSDGPHYGQLAVFEFPKQKVVFGPRQVIARINQDQVISPQMTLWNQQGSEVIQGTLLVIPIEESLLYIRPLYLRSAGGQDPRAEARDRGLPQPDRDGRDARGVRSTASSRRAAATRKIGGRRPGRRPWRRPRRSRRPQRRRQPARGPDGARRRRPRRLRLRRRTPRCLPTSPSRRASVYQRAIDAQRAGDWARYGEEIKRLGEILEKMAQERRAQ